LRPASGFLARRVYFSSPQKIGVRLLPDGKNSPINPGQLFSLRLDIFFSTLDPWKNIHETAERVKGDYELTKMSTVV
jgi:hypothetical protein